MPASFNAGFLAATLESLEGETVQASFADARWTGPIHRTAGASAAAGTHADEGVMTTRLAIEPARGERSVTVTAAAERLSSDQTTIRELLRKVLLCGLREGKTDKPNGVRVKMWSIEERERRHAIGGLRDSDKSELPSRYRRPPVGNVARLEPMAALKAFGI